MLIEIIDQLIPKAVASPTQERACLFGDGFFTTAIIHNHRLRHQTAHFERLIQSAQRLQFAEFDLIQLQETLHRLCHKINTAIIRISISRQQTQRGYAISDQAQSICKIQLFQLPPLPTEPCQLIDAKTTISCNPTLAGVKHLNRLDNVLAASEISIHQQAHREVLMYHQQNVICGSRSNLFVQMDGQWLTPQLDQCGVEGITRNRVLQLFEENNTHCQISEITRTDLVNAKAAFVCNSLVGVWPVVLLNGKSLNLTASEQIAKQVSRI